MNPYESQQLLDQYLLFHYASAEETLEWDFGPEAALNFAQRTVDETFDWERVESSSRALDIGCAVGRSSFELSKHCAEVIGIDFSQAFIDTANKLRSFGKLAYERHDEGNAYTQLMANPPAGANADRVTFEQGDAQQLRDDIGEFDLVHAANLLCRLPEPLRFLQQLPTLIRSGGQFVITTPCTWLDEFTPRENWPSESTLDYLKTNLGADFGLLKTLEMPFLIRETRRKHQWTVAQTSVWLRR
ncbi:MAG: putative 4-mercaptohistidine N1-methyltransferase [Verrucomicrobiota bacterium]